MDADELGLRPITALLTKAVIHSCPSPSTLLKVLVSSWLQQPGFHAWPRRQAALAGLGSVYLQRFCTAFNLGTQCSATRAAIICSKLHKGKIIVLKPHFPSLALICTPASIPDYGLPWEFPHLSYYMTMALS